MSSYDGQQTQAQNAGYPEQREEEVKLEPIEDTGSSCSSSSSYNRHEDNKRVDSAEQEADELDQYPLERRVTRAEIDDKGRRDLQRVLTTASQKISRQFTIAKPGDPAVDPSSDSFDLPQFLKTYRKQLENQGIELKQLSVVYKNLNVFGSGKALQLQKTVTDIFLAPFRAREYLNFGKTDRKQILHSFDGIIKTGEMCVVLGRPGSGCSTLLKALTGELHGLETDKSEIHYNGIPQQKMMKEFKGETVYNQEVDKHFPHLTVGQTLEFAAAVRTPSNRPMEASRQEFARFVAKVVMAILGLSHTYNTKVGNDFVRGVSGGERKRVSVAEMLLAGAPFAAWDNSTRGLDSATALKFVKSLRVGSDLTGGAAAIAIYQASQSVYDCFDKATVLYEGRQIYFGPANMAKGFFERQGWHSPPRQTTGDFLTAVTNPQERQPRNGMENKVPRTPEEFEKYWRDSPEYQNLLGEIKVFEEEFPVNEQGTLEHLRRQKNYIQAKHARPKSPYLISIPMQVKLNVRRAYQRIWGDVASTATQASLSLIVALVVGSMYFGHSEGSASFQGRGAILFLAILFNALVSIGEISGLYSQRAIVEKHNSYKFYHPATEAIAGIVADIPVKFIQATVFDIVLYFLGRLRYTAGQFFIFFIVTYMSTFIMAAIFRTTAAVTKTASQAMAGAGVLVLVLVIYTGFVIRIPEMPVYFGWLRHINPIFYAFEILLANEFHGVNFPCDRFVPQGPQYPQNGNSFICNTQGAVAGQAFVSGDRFIEVSYQYSWSHVWRNFGILWAFLIFFMATYFIAVEINSSSSNTAEKLVFQRGHVPAYMLKDRKGSSDEETDGTARPGEEEKAGDVSAIEEQKGILTWRNVVYDIEIKGEPRRLLDHVSGYVKPGTMTALMGVSGAGKTTLLDALAQRTTMGVITGDMFVNGAPLDSAFQRSTGYVQQQDLHLETSTVREALRFSAILRQPKSVSRQEKYAYVEEVIKMLNMSDFSNAVVGVPGEGLNVEQRKRLTIGVELAARPKLLLFLDEPTSGLDSQSSWSIIAFLRELASAGQAILCTIHQPSAILFQEFDRLLFLARGGRTVYFGELGENSQTLLHYFENNGARKCGADENPAEYMLEIVNQIKNENGQDWFDVWNGSEQAKGVQRQIDAIHVEKQHEKLDIAKETGGGEFAMPLTAQIWECTYRAFQQYWRMPSYVLAKMGLCTVAGLFIGFSFFQANSSQAGMQTIIFAVFMLTTIFSSLVQQIQPLFITQRSLYESRERPSKAYSWIAFMIANVIVELPYGVFAGILMFASFYYPVVGASQSSGRQGLVLMFSIQLLIYTSTFADMTVAALPNAETASGIVSLLTLMSLLFNGVMQPASQLPGFWRFMYRASPFTYWVGGVVSTMLAGRPVTCSTSEVSVFDPPAGQTCGAYLQTYASMAGGAIQNPDATSACHYCSLKNADQFLAGSSIYYGERWRNFGLLFVYIIFNVFIAVLTYYLFRVANLSSLTAKLHRTKKGAKAKHGADKAVDGAAAAVQQAGHTGNRSGEKDAGTA
ncbi:ABC multidrug transporter-like protein [Cucurbitaria berberidis CBS 394.84]|uniref:ABC multidrug transporter-like protein n=1 Tax=Cucurbitaria berberidis CBS 394.84 TaxID=1168544 RepID=A0A9P4GD30_9PLEO|nr:ABC multidrug transporter-like protein [Cucurbitaria berberidis CBS 394.84]KAF1843407.1 ABC multidrug transporter-like protein [Cucurbitaria berberidis CBS 394.84]